MRNQQDCLKLCFNHVRQEDLISYGLIPELVGRLPVLSSLENLSTEDMMRILTEPKNSMIKQYQKLFLLEGVVLEFTKGALKAIAKLAMKKEVGARALRSVMEDKLMSVMYELPDKKDVVGLTIEEAFIMDNKKPVYRKDKNLKTA